MLRAERAGRSRGVTLIELIIGIAIMSMLIVMAVPNFTGWIRNTRIRTATESILSGLQLARVEALKGNARVNFQLVSALDDSCVLQASGPHWVVSLDPVASLDPAKGKCAAAPVACSPDDESACAKTDANAPRLIQKHDGLEGNGGRTKIAAGQSLVTFTGMGRLATTSAVMIDVSDTIENCVVPPAAGDPVGTARCMRIEISAAGSIRMCDPALTADPQGCTP